MGYRSDVTIVLEEKDFNRMLGEIKDNDEARNLLREATLRKQNDLISMSWNRIKWYDGYEDVDFFEEFKKSCKNSYTLEIGESYDDCSETLRGDNYSMCDMAYIERHIDLSGDEVSVEEILQKHDEAGKDKSDKPHKSSKNDIGRDSWVL